MEDQVYRVRRTSTVWNEDPEVTGAIQGSDGYWTVAVPDLREFARKYGTVILEPPQEDDGLFEIEVYDTWRE